MAWQAGPHPDDTPRRVVKPPEPPFIPRRIPVVRRPRADTGPAVALELLPLLPVALSMMAPLFTGGWSLWIVLQFALLTSIVQFAVAARDSRILRDRGFVDPASALLALLPSMVYLAVRARRAEGHDPDAWVAVRWAIGTTIAAVVLVMIGEGFQLAIAPLFGPPEA